MQVTHKQRKAWLDNTAQSPFNRWLDDQVRSPDGRLDLERLHALARSYGIDRQDQYAHLNPGQQRMNIGNLLRRAVLPSEYRDVTGPAALAGPLTRNAGGLRRDLPTPPRPEVIQTASVRDLLTMHGQIIDELRDREVIRTSNAPLGDYAELLFATAFGWSLEGNSSAGHDATDVNGVRFQIKARRITARNRSRQLSAIRKLPEGNFDMLAAALFDEAY